MKKTIQQPTKRYRVTAGIFKNHEFDGYIHETRVIDTETVGRSYPSNFCELVTGYPEWTTPKHLNPSDHFRLKRIFDLHKIGQMSEAMEYAMYSCDTTIREEIPPQIWLDLGGQLTTAGKEKLKLQKV